MNQEGESLPEIDRSYCNACGQKTKHVVIAKRTVVSDQTEYEGKTIVIAGDAYRMLECQGCESVSLEHQMLDEPNDIDETVLYPPRVFRRPPKWVQHLPIPIRGLLEEVYVALQNNSRRLAMMGSRALVDLVILDTVGDVGTFEEKLEALEKKGTVSSKGREILVAALDAGSAAVHRGYLPQPHEMTAVMDIVENLLQATYHLEGLADRLRKATPPRKPKTP